MGSLQWMQDIVNQVIRGIWIIVSWGWLSRQKCMTMNKKKTTAKKAAHTFLGSFLSVVRVYAESYARESFRYVISRCVSFYIHQSVELQTAIDPEPENQHSILLRTLSTVFPRDFTVELLCTQGRITAEKKEASESRSRKRRVLDSYIEEKEVAFHRDAVNILW